jgi:hypothetical protein
VASRLVILINDLILLLESILHAREVVDELWKKEVAFAHFVGPPAFFKMTAPTPPLKRANFITISCLESLNNMLTGVGR